MESATAAHFYCQLTGVKSKQRQVQKKGTKNITSGLETATPNTQLLQAPLLFAYCFNSTVPCILANQLKDGCSHPARWTRTTEFKKQNRSALGAFVWAF